jgi:ABC-type sugar transport system ATPase subunit
LNDKKITKWSSKLALNNGIAMIHQELALVPGMTVYENIFLGIEKNTLGVLNKKNYQLFHKLDKKIGFNLDPNEKIYNLRIADQQKVEILRALARNAKVIIMDEPTSSLTNDEVKKLHSLMIKLKIAGYLIIYVSHFLDAILEVCDKVSILRDGNLIRSGEIKFENKSSIVEAMLGTKQEVAFPKKRITIDNKNTVLNLQNIKSLNGVNNVNLTIHKGEVVGLLGLVGSGRTEILRSIFGLDKIIDGKIDFFDQKINPNKPEDAIKQGIVMIPEDRRKQGLVFTQNTRSNISITDLKKVSKNQIINSQKESLLVKELIELLDIKPNLIDGNISFYSGGNQQKVLFAKWIFSSPKLILLDEPTRGIDIGAKRKIYELINNLSEKGVSILLVSSELEEVMGLADRAYLVKNGKTINEIIPKDTSIDDVLFELFDAKKELINE